MLLLTTKPELQLIQAAGLLGLWASGYVEPVIGPPQPYHVLAQQILALTLQEGSLPRSRWADIVGRLPVFAEIIESGLGERILDHLVEHEMLFDEGHGILSMGPGGERSYGYRHFLDLTSAFTSNPLFVVRHGSKEIGYLDPISLLTNDRHFASVLLAGRVWQVTSIDWDRRFAWVEPIEGGGESRWLGDGRPLSAELCDSIRDALDGADPAGVTMTTRASSALEGIRSSFQWVRSGRTAVVKMDQGLSWWTFAGLHANAALMAAMGPLLGGAKADNLAIKLDPDAATVEKVRDFAELLDQSTMPTSSIAEQLASKLKFSDCLPEDVALSIAGARVADVSAIRRASAEPIDSVGIEAPAGDETRS